MRKRGFIAYDPLKAKEFFNSDLVIAVYYEKLLRYDAILMKDSQGFFCRSAKQIFDATCITSKQQDRVRDWLVYNNYIVTMLKIPDGKSAPQMHFKIIREI